MMLHFFVVVTVLYVVIVIPKTFCNNWVVRVIEDVFLISSAVYIVYIAYSKNKYNYISYQKVVY